ncbi:MAG: protein kinase domain-containing protein [Planctomycetota bacterium]
MKGAKPEESATAGSYAPSSEDGIPEALRNLVRYEVLCRLGEGCMGAVYLARERATGHEVVLKTLLSFDPQALYRLKSEFRSLADIAHPNLVGLGELVSEDGLWFFTMDYVDGIDLLAYVRPRSDTFDEDRVRATFLQLARAAQAMHARDRVHRDLKPHNVLVTREGHVVVLDFGLAAEVGADPERGIVGTLEYMAPEQAGREVGPAADWYSVGVLLYAALTGHPPFRGDTIEVLVKKHKRTPRPPSTIVPNLPRDLTRLCLDLLKAKPEDRPSGREVLRRLGDVGEDTSEAAAPEGEPAFVGRAAEFGVLEAAWKDARTAGAIVCVAGEAGVGKSALVRRFLARAAEGAQGMLLLAGRCYERETAPFKAFDGLIDDLSRHLVDREPELLVELIADLDLGPLLRVFPALARVPGMLGDGEAVDSPTELSGVELRNRAFRALRLLLARLASLRDPVLFVDDLHWADADSLALLAEVMPESDAPPLLFVVTARPGVGTPPPPQARRIALGLLEPEDARALARDLLGDDAEAGRVVGEAGGHPLFLCELARYVAEAGSEAAATSKLEDALAARVERLTPEVRQALELVCVAGVPTSQGLLQRASGLPVGPWRTALGALRSARLARTRGGAAASQVEPYHDRVRETVYGGLTEEPRRAWHARLAEALESDESPDPELLVRHLVAAGEPGRAASYAKRAARAADAALAFDHAADLYALALRYAEDETPSQAQPLRLALAEALVNAGRGPESAAVYFKAAEHTTGSEHLMCLLRGGEQLLISGHLEEGLAALKESLTEVGRRLPATPRRALLSLLWRRAALRVRGLGWEPRAAEDVPEGLLRQVDVHRAIAVGLGHVDIVRAADFQARGVQLALRSGEPGRVCRALALEAIFTSVQGCRALARTERLIAAANHAAQAAGDVYSEAWVISARGCRDYFAKGDFVSSVTLLSEAEQVFRDRAAGATWELANARAIQMFAQLKSGDLAEVCKRVPELLRDAERRGDRFMAATLARKCNGVWLVADADELAAEQLARWTWPGVEGAFHIQQWYELWAEGELALYRGQGASAAAPLRPRFRAIVGSLLNRIQMVRTESAWLRGRLAVAAALDGQGANDTEACLREAEAVARRLDAAGQRYAGAWAKLVLAAVSAQRGDTEAACERLRAAHADAVASQARLVTATAALRLAQLTGDVAAAAAATSDLRGHGVANPDRMAELLAPGFREVG